MLISRLRHAKSRRERQAAPTARSSPASSRSPTGRCLTEMRPALAERQELLEARARHSPRLPSRRRRPGSAGSGDLADDPRQRAAWMQEVRVVAAYRDLWQSRQRLASRPWRGDGPPADRRGPRHGGRSPRRRHRRGGRAIRRSGGVACEGQFSGRRLHSRELQGRVIPSPKSGRRRASERRAYEWSEPTRRRTSCSPLFAPRAAIHGYLRFYMPTNRAVDRLRTPRGLKWAIPVALVATPAYLFAMSVCATIVERGGPATSTCW